MYENLTIQQVRDKLAEMDGWKYEPEQVDGMGAQAHYWWRWTISSSHGGRTYSNTHPFPETLDAAAAALPKHWLGTICNWMGKSTAQAWPPIADGNHYISDGPNEIVARYRLALTCRLADKEAK